MSKTRKRLIGMGVLLALLGVGAYFQYRPTNDLDTEAAGNEGVQKVLEAEKSKDTGALTQMSKSDDAAVARRAVSALYNVSGGDAIRDSLEDPRPDVRSTAVSSLGISGDPAELETLSQFMQDPAPEVRIAAIRGVSNIRDFSIFEHLMTKLSDPQPSVRRAALGAIEARIGLKYPDFNPEDSPESNARAINRMRSMIPKMKQVFDQANEFELSHQKNK